MSSSSEEMTVPQNPLIDENVKLFQNQFQTNPEAFVAEIRRLQDEVARLQAAPAPDPPIPTPASTSSPSSVPAMDPQIAALLQLLLTRNSESKTDLRSEKLPDISEYDGDEAKLDSWEQSLIQRMHVNHDRYSTDASKIAYAENRLTIGKRAHNLMNAYRVDGICRLTTFSEWRSALRLACGNPFEQEDARKYLRETLKQGSLSFEEYNTLFSQKKDRSRMEDASLIDAMKANINYSVQTAAVHYRVPGTNLEPITFDEHVAMWLSTDRKIRQIRHLAPKATTPATSAPANRRNGTNLPAAPFPRTVVTGTVTPSIPTPAFPPAGDPMDLSQAMAAVKGQSLKTEGVRKICENWNLCFYCKLQHLGSASDCPNKPTKRLRNMEVVSTLTPETDDSGNV